MAGLGNPISTLLTTSTLPKENWVITLLWITSIISHFALRTLSNGWAYATMETTILTATFTSTSKTHFSQVTKMSQSHMHFAYLFIILAMFTSLSMLKIFTAALFLPETLVPMVSHFLVTTAKATCMEFGTKWCTLNTITSQDQLIKLLGMLSNLKLKVWWPTELKQFQTQRFIKIWILRGGLKTAITSQSRGTTEYKWT